MTPALVRFSKRILINQNAKNPVLKSIWTKAYQASMARLQDQNMTKWEKDNQNLAIKEELVVLIKRIFEQNALSGIVPEMADLSGTINFSFDKTNGVMINPLTWEDPGVVHSL